MTTISVVTVTQCEKDEWSRMAIDAYRTDRNDFGHRYSAAASLPHGFELRAERYDALQGDYRKWLIGGWAEVERTDGAPAGWAHV